MPSASKRKKGRPLATNVTQEKDKQRRRSQSVSHEKNLCITCQITGGHLHKIKKKETRQKMLEVSQKLIDKRMYCRLSSTVSPEDAIANDVLPHQK